MAIVKVSELTETTSPQANDELLINDGGVSKKLKVSNFVNAAITANNAKVTNATHTGDVTGATALTIGTGKVITAMILDDNVTADKLANSINAEIAANTAKVTNATHTGDVTGATALTIAADAVTYAKMQNVSADERILGRVSGANGVIEELTKAQMLTMLNVEDGSTADQTAAQIKTALDNGIDSVHYVDGSIDLAHMSSESVDEDNLHISNAGTNGFFLSKQSGNTGGLTWAAVPESEDYIPNGSVMVFFQASAPTGWTKVTTQNDKTLRVVSGSGGGTGGDWAMSAGETTSQVGAHTHTSAAHTHTGASHTHTGASHSHGGGNMAAAATTISTSTMPSHSHSVPYGSGNTIYSANSIYYQPNFDSAGATGSNTGSIS